MTRRRIVLAVAFTVAIIMAAWGLTVGLERVMRPQAETPPAESTAPQQPASTPVRHITATLFHAAAEGEHLVAVQQDVPFGEGPVEQGRQLVIAQLTTQAKAPLLTPVPPGAKLRSFYVSEQGEAFVDLGPEIVRGHPGGSTAELLTVYAIVNAVTANLPAVKRVQILIEGQEADTLAGHVDLRRPLQRNDAIVGDAVKATAAPKQ